jgi:hypothetical protein
MIEIYPQFLPKKLFKIIRQEFEQPHDPFVWQPWYVRDQYQHLKTPAQKLLTTETFENLYSSLTHFAREEYGCYAITPPWMSLYMNGHYQGLHADLPHGPWAYVLSLTLNSFSKKSEGGETLILSEETLQYWNHYQKQIKKNKNTELNFLTQRIQPKENQLLIFDPSIPHGVNPVRSSSYNPEDGRLVIHGWFTQPAPYLSGALSQTKKHLQATSKVINQTLGTFLETHAFDDFKGIWTVKMMIRKDGSVEAIQECVSHLRYQGQLKHAVIDSLKNEIAELLAHGLFPKAQAKSQLTLPIIFD